MFLKQELKKLQESHETLLEDSNIKDQELIQLKQNATSSNEAFQTEKEAVEREYASLQKKVGNKKILLDFFNP